MGADPRVSKAPSCFMPVDNRRTAVIPAVPCRAIKELHRETADELGLGHDVRAEVERLLGELQQLLAGISIMQACAGSPLAWLFLTLPLCLFKGWVPLEASLGCRYSSLISDSYTDICDSPKFAKEA